jgi:hypothetical protein
VVEAFAQVGVDGPLDGQQTPPHTRPETGKGYFSFDFIIPMDGFRREGGQAHGDILGAGRRRRAVADPLAGMGDDRLAGPDIQRFVFRFHPQQPLEHKGVFIEFRPLARLLPSARRDHAGDTHCPGVRIDLADIFFDTFGPGASRFDNARTVNFCGHEFPFGVQRSDA